MNGGAYLLSKSIKRTGFGPNLFDEWRYLDHGEPGMDNSKRPLNPDFVLNQPRYQGASILLARKNFGCGSSREHAPWALMQYGFRAVIAPSFADIFYNNSLKNGLLPVVLPELVIDRLFDACNANEGYKLTVDLDRQLVVEPDGTSTPFEVAAFRRWGRLSFITASTSTSVWRLIGTLMTSSAPLSSSAWRKSPGSIRCLSSEKKVSENFLKRNSYDAQDCSFARRRHRHGDR